MTSKIATTLLLAAATLAVCACSKTSSSGGTASAETKNTAAEASNDPITSAESAAPASLAHDAAIVSPDASGAMKTLRAGKNGWTCTPDDPSSPGKDPMCMDQNASKWLEAMMAHKTPPDGTPGVIYMLEGGSDASNTDPNAKQPPAGSDWIKTGPYIMIVGSKAMLAGYPGGAKPDTSAPYVMWAGTPYAHLMVPVGKS